MYENYIAVDVAISIFSSALCDGKMQELFGEIYV
jgi:hypothetical protein